MRTITITELEKLCCKDWWNDVYVHFGNNGTFGYELWKRRNSNYIKKYFERNQVKIDEKEFTKQYRLFG